MGEIRYGPSGLPEAPTFEEAFAALRAEGYRACEIGFASGFWLDYEAAPLFAAARTPRTSRFRYARWPRSWATWTVARSSRWRSGCSTTPQASPKPAARLIVFHPGFLLGRDHEQTIADVVDQLGTCASGSRRRTASSRSASR
jgi:endonuclease IV